MMALPPFARSTALNRSVAIHRTVCRRGRQAGVLAAAEIRDEATRNGVPGSLAAAIAWQESGFNNAMVSAANARGVMQVMPRYVGLGAEEPGRLAAGSQLPAGQRARGRPLPRHAPALRGRRPRDRGGRLLTRARLRWRGSGCSPKPDATSTTSAPARRGRKEPATLARRARHGRAPGTHPRLHHSEALRIRRRSDADQPRSRSEHASPSRRELLNLAASRPDLLTGPLGAPYGAGGFVINRPTVAFTEQEPVIAQVAPIPGSQG